MRCAIAHFRAFLLLKPHTVAWPVGLGAGGVLARPPPRAGGALAGARARGPFAGHGATAGRCARGGRFELGPTEAVIRGQL